MSAGKLPDWQRTKHAGVFVRHRQDCPAREAGRCRCQRSYRVRYRDDDGRSRWSRVLSSEAEARGWQVDRRRGQAPEARAHTRARPFRELAEVWIAGVESGDIAQRRSHRPYAPRTVRLYRTDLKRYVLPDMGGRAAEALTAADWQTWLEALRRQGLKRNTIDRILNTPRNIYRWACSPTRRLLPVNATLGLELPARDETPRDRVAPPDEARELLAALEPGDRAGYALAFYGGLRRGEFLALEWSDVSLEERRVRVVRSKTEAGIRSVPITAALRTILLEAWMRQGRPSAGRVVVGPRGDGLSEHALRSRALVAWERAGLERITPHECRHTFASYCIASGMNAKAITVLMGHSSVDVTFDRYGHLFPGHEAEAADRLDSYLAGARVTNLVTNEDGDHAGIGTSEPL